MDFRHVYNKLSRTYDHRHAGPTTRQIRKNEVRIVKRFASGRTLDAGCGTGFHLPLVKDAVGMDVSEGMLDRVRSDNPLVQASCESIPFRKGSFDTVMCMFFVLNACNHWKAVSEMARILKPGGRIIISVASIWDWDYKSLKDKKEDIVTEEMKHKKFQISGEDVELRLFTRDELTGLFRKTGLSLEFFDSTFILQMPKWGDLTRFSLKEKTKLRMEGSHPKEYGVVYFMVFRKS